MLDRVVMSGCPAPEREWRHLDTCDVATYVQEQDDAPAAFFGRYC